MRVDETGAAVRELEGGAEIRSVPVDYETNEDPGWTLDDFIKEQRKKIRTAASSSQVGIAESGLANLLARLESVKNMARRTGTPRRKLL